MQSIHSYIVVEGESEDPDELLSNDGNYPEKAVYTSMRTYNSRAFELDHHLIRLKQSARLMGFKIFPTLLQIRQQVEQLIEQSPEETQFLKITATPDHLVIVTRPLHIDEKIYDGVSVVTKNLSRTQVRIKSFPDKKMQESYQSATADGHHDVLLVNDQGLITEGSRSNFLWITGNSLHWCSDALEGITQANVMKCFKTLQREQPELQLKMTPGLPEDNLSTVDELFITQTSRGLIPVTEVNGIHIGNGKPGRLTKTLLEAFRKHVITLSS